MRETMMKVSVVVGENNEILGCTLAGEIKGSQDGPLEHMVRPEAGQMVYELDVEDILFEKNPTEINRYLQQLMGKRRTK